MRQQLEIGHVLPYLFYNSCSIYISVMNGFA